MNIGEYLIATLEAWQVDTVFGIPGVHTAELYRGLAGSSIRHVTARHEQGAGFMADGYARTSGKPGVCFVITGPGLANIATAMLQARADSIPMLVVSSTLPRSGLSMQRGQLHEMPDQHSFGRELGLFSHTVTHPEQLPEVLQRAWSLFESARPGPVHIDIPLDIMTSDASGVTEVSARLPQCRPVADEHSVSSTLDTLLTAKKPMVIIGGGAREAADDALSLAEKLGCPLLATLAASDRVPARHPLVLGASPSCESVRSLIAASDVVLVAGSELGDTDFDMYATGVRHDFGKLIRIDIDANQLHRNYSAHITCCGDALDALARLDRALPKALMVPEVYREVERARADALAEQPEAYRAQIAIFETLRDARPELVVVGDSTQPVYACSTVFSPGNSGMRFQSSGGFGTLGYAIPAALGAKLGKKDAPVIALTGDGGAQFCLAELGTIADAREPLVVVVWNNSGYREIEHYMKGIGVEPSSCAVSAPDFSAIAAAYGLNAIVLDSPEALVASIGTALDQGGCTVIDVRGVD